MGRHAFGGDLTAWVFALGDTQTAGSGATGPVALVQPGATITVWSAQAGGAQITDLLDSTGTPTSTITSDATTGEIPTFQGPDTNPETFTLWADAGAGRQLMLATDIGVLAAANAASIASLLSQVAAFANAPQFVYYNDAASAYPTRPATGAPIWWVGPVKPAIGGTGAVDDLDYHIGP